jgi:hypothetical protein
MRHDSLRVLHPPALLQQSSPRSADQRGTDQRRTSRNASAQSGAEHYERGKLRRHLAFGFGFGLTLAGHFRSWARTRTALQTLACGFALDLALALIDVLRQIQRAARALRAQANAQPATASAPALS